MAQSHSPEAQTHGTGARQTHFPDAEWEALQASDRQAARNIVCLMGGIFILGLIGYLLVCWSIST
jgi:hypothetical protein